MADVKCPKCGAIMEQGFLASRSLDFTRPDDWVAGPPEHSVFFGTKVKSKKHAQIEAYRCPNDHYVEFYARDVPQEG
jgi:predicted nucleic-acid-binding Zn-ribbon protein